MADKKLSSVSAVSDMNFVYAETSSGETVKISKADLASVVAGLIGIATPNNKGLMGKNAFHINRQFPSSGDANNVETSGIYRVNGNATNLPNSGYGLLVVFASEDSANSSIAQIFFGGNTTSVWVRNKWTSTQTWSDWTKIN